MTPLPILPLSSICTTAGPTACAIACGEPAAPTEGEELPGATVVPGIVEALSLVSLVVVVAFSASVELLPPCAARTATAATMSTAPAIALTNFLRDLCDTSGEYAPAPLECVGGGNGEPSGGAGGISRHVRERDSSCGESWGFGGVRVICLAFTLYLRHNVAGR